MKFMLTMQLEMQKDLIVIKLQINASILIVESKKCFS